MKIKHLFTSTFFYAACTMGVNAQITIDPDTNYQASDFSNETLSASAADLGSTRMFDVDLANTSWSGGASATPHFSAFQHQDFRLADFSGANWSGVSFTLDPADLAGTSNQYFYQAKFINADFSNTTFNFGTGGDQAFSAVDFSGADFSGAYISGGGGNMFAGAIFSSTTNFSGATILSGLTDAGGVPASLGGADFSNATLRIRVEGADLSGVNFQNVTFIDSDGISSVLRNSVANLTDFRGTDFTGLGYANWLDNLTWDAGMAPLYNDNTVFTTQRGTIDPVALGWTYSAIPEPNASALIAGLFIAAVCVKRRRRESTHD